MLLGTTLFRSLCPGALRMESNGMFVQPDSNRIALDHFRATNFVAIPGMLGREQNGAPMGDALSGTILRLFKWTWEQACRNSENRFGMRRAGSQCRLCHVYGSDVLVLDVSFRDDLRQFCAWRRSCNLTEPFVLQWARSG